jgi:hypothetical protein
MSELSDASVEDLEKIANAIFDIASSNKFYSEMYAQLYSELIEIYPVFKTVLDQFIYQYDKTVQEIQSVDPETDYDLFCQYNKQNDKRKATTVFIVFLMKKGVVVAEKVVELVGSLLEKILVYIDTPGKLNEIEEMTELVNLFIVEGYVHLHALMNDSSRTDYSLDKKQEWKMYIEKIQIISGYKVKEKASMSSRVLFKYMDMMKIIGK